MIITQKFRDSIDELILKEAPKDPELADGIRLLDIKAKEQGIVFYEMAFKIMLKYDAKKAAEAVKEEFGIVVSPQQVQTYHPEKHAGRNLSKTFKDLFYELRAKFREETDAIPIANKAYRIKVLHRMASNAEKNKNIS